MAFLEKISPTTKAGLLGALGGVALATLAAHVPALTPSWCRPRAGKAVYVLIVEMKLSAERGGVEAFKRAWAVLAADVKAREDRCLTYELSQSVDDPNSISIFERYVDQADLDVTHRAGVAFKEFGRQLSKGGALEGLVVSRSMRTFRESGVGYMNKSADTFVLVVEMTLNAQMGGVAALKAAWAGLAADVKAREPNCLSYELIESTQDPLKVVIYERYASRSDLDVAHQAGAAFKAFGKRLGEQDLKGLVVEKKKSYFIESGVGYWAK